MKADENPLAQNELGRQITGWADRVEPHTNKILGLLLIATVVTIGVMLYRRTGTATATKAWTDYYECQTPADFETFLEDFPSTPATPWARMEAGRQRLFEGYRTSMTNRADSLKALKKAQNHFQTLLQEEAPPEIRERGLAGLAMTNEALCDGDVKPVTDAYENLLKEYPETYYKAWAEHRLEILKKPGTGDFYKWYAKQDPKPTDRPAPRDGRPQIPGLENLPSLQNIFNQDLMKDDDKKPAAGDAPAAPKATDDKTTEEKKPEEKKADDKAADAPAKPADEPKKEGDPAAEKPADAKPAAEAKPEAAPAEKPAAPAEEAPKDEAKPATEAKPESK